MEDGDEVRLSCSRGRRAGPSSSSTRPHRTASPIGSSTRGFRAVCGDVRRKIQQFYTLDLMPESFVVKFRQEVEGLYLSANFEVDGHNTSDCHTKLVIKSASEKYYWKIACVPQQRNVRIMTKKIPVGSLLHFQFGIGHDFIRNSTDWKWNVTSAFGLSGSPGVLQKTELPIFPGFDINVNWNAQYELPELYGASSAGESPFQVNYGHLHAKIQRVAAVYTHFG